MCRCQCGSVSCPCVCVCAVHAAGGHAPEADAPQHDEQHAAEHLAAALHDDRQRPPEHDQRAGAEREQQRVADGEPHRDAERARALDRRRFAAGAERQRRDRHQVIGAEPVENAQKECGGKKDHGWDSNTTGAADLRLIVHATGTVTGA